MLLCRGVGLRLLAYSGYWRRVKDFGFLIEEGPGIVIPKDSRKISLPAPSVLRVTNAASG